MKSKQSTEILDTGESIAFTNTYYASDKDHTIYIISRAYNYDLWLFCYNSATNKMTKLKIDDEYGAYYKPCISSKDGGTKSIVIGYCNQVNKKVYYRKINDLVNFTLGPRNEIQTNGKSIDSLSISCSSTKEYMMFKIRDEKSYLHSLEDGSLIHEINSNEINIPCNAAVSYNDRFMYCFYECYDRGYKIKLEIGVKNFNGGFDFNLLIEVADSYPSSTSARIGGLRSDGDLDLVYNDGTYYKYKKLSGFDGRQLETSTIMRSNPSWGCENISVCCSQFVETTPTVMISDNSGTKNDGYSQGVQMCTLENNGWKIISHPAVPSYKSSFYASAFMSEVDGHVAMVFCTEYIYQNGYPYPKNFHLQTYEPNEHWNRTLKVS